MNNLAFAFSSSAMAFVVGVGTMPQTSTIEPPFDSHQQVNVPTAIAAGQTASSNVEMEIMVLRLIGVDNYRRLQEISQLAEGWDGYSAQPIPQEVISRTKELLMILPEGAKIFPTGRSTVQIEYHKNVENYFELEISATEYAFYSVMGDDEFEDSIPESEIVDKVKAFMV